MSVAFGGCQSVCWRARPDGLFTSQCSWDEIIFRVTEISLIDINIAEIRPSTFFLCLTISPDKGKSKPPEESGRASSHSFQVHLQRAFLPHKIIYLLDPIMVVIREISVSNLDIISADLIVRKAIKKLPLWTRRRQIGYQNITFFSRQFLGPTWHGWRASRWLFTLDWSLLLVF